MSDRVNGSPLRRHSAAVIATLVLITLIVILGPFAFETAVGRRESERQARHLVDDLAIGNTKQQVEEMLGRSQNQRLTLVKIDPASWQVRTPEVIGAGNWVIWLDFDGDILSRVAVRTADSDRIAPADAPPDKLRAR